MSLISCSKCQKNDVLSYFVTSCGDLILCEECATSFVTKTHCICPNCKQEVRIQPYQDDESKNEVICDAHKKSCEFFCKNCKEFLCGDCILEQLNKPENKHENHEIVKIELLFDKANKQAADSIKILQSLYNNVVQNIKKCKSTIKSIESAYDVTLNLMYNSFNKIQEHVSEAKEEYDSKIIERANKNEKFMKEVQTLTNDCEEILTSTDSRITSVSYSVCKKISKIVNDIENNQNAEPLDLPKSIFTNELIPPFSGFTIVIPKFIETYKSNTFKTIYTPSVDMYHGKWRTKIHLSEKDNITNLSIFLEFLSGIGGPLVMEYKVQINHPTKNEYLTKSFKSEFNVMDSWGWIKFAQVDTIINGGFVKEDDSLSLEIKLRPASYAEYAKIFEKLLDRYKAKYKELKQKIKSSELNEIEISNQHNE